MHGSPRALAPPSLPGSESTPSKTWPGRAPRFDQTRLGHQIRAWHLPNISGFGHLLERCRRRPRHQRACPAGWLKHGQGLQWDRCIFLFTVYIYICNYIYYITLHNYIDYSCILYIYSVVDTKHEILNNMRLQLAPLKPREVSRLARVDTMEKGLPRVARPLGRSNWVKQLAIADGSAKEKSSGSAEGKKRVA